MTPSMSTRCLKPNTLRVFEFLKSFVAFFAVCSRRIVAVNAFRSRKPQPRYPKNRPQRGGGSSRTDRTAPLSRVRSKFLFPFLFLSTVGY